MELLPINSFVLLILIPSLFFRLGVSVFADLTNKKLNLYDNFRYFLLPSSVISIGCYLWWHDEIALPISLLIFKFKDLQSLNFPKIILAIFMVNFFVVLGGLLTGFVLNLYLSKAKHSLQIGEGIFSVSWLTVFKELLSLEVMVYVKLKSGDIYRGKLRHFSLDSNHDLEIVCLADCTRRVYEKDDSSSDLKFKSLSVDLSQGLIIFRANEIENIWFPNSFVVADFEADTEALMNVINKVVSEAQN